MCLVLPVSVLATRKLDRSRSFSWATHMVCRAGLASRALLLPCVSPASHRGNFSCSRSCSRLWSSPLVTWQQTQTEEAVTSSSISPMVDGVRLLFAFYFPS
eukprot:scaffold633_cov134-Isochrysis_galbana.AAC.8